MFVAICYQAQNRNSQPCKEVPHSVVGRVYTALTKEGGDGRCSVSAQCREEQLSIGVLYSETPRGDMSIS